MKDKMLFSFDDIKNKDIRVVLQNLASLSVLQILNNILPLVTMPYLVKVLGPAKYGLISYAQALVQYFVALTNYGFDLTATREISIHRDDIKKVSQIFCTVFVIKIIFMIISLIILLAITFSFSILRSDWYIYLMTFGMVVGDVLFPYWFFQGVEKMKYITIINAFSKIIFTIGVFVFIKNENDYLLVPILYNIGFLISGLWSLCIIFKHFGLIIRFPSYQDIVTQLKDGWHVFVSTTGISLNTYTTIIILGIFTNNTCVGYYSAGEKLIRAIQRMVLPIQQAVFPYFNRIAMVDGEGSYVFLRKLTISTGGLTLSIVALLLIFSNLIISMLFGQGFSESLWVFRILSLIVFFSALGSIFGIQAMLSFNYKREFVIIIFLGFFLNVFLSVVLSLAYQHIGAAIAVLLTEAIICMSLFLFIYKKGIRIL